MSRLFFKWLPTVMALSLTMLIASGMIGLVFGDYIFISVMWLLVASGSFSNYLVVTLNNEKMPVLGMEYECNDYCPVTTNTKFLILTDVIRVGNAAFSVGDLLILVGITTAIVYPLTFIVAPLL